MHIGPAKNYEIKWVYQRAGLPVEITAEFENWRRIRDSDGTEGWVYHSLLSGRRTGVVTAKSKDELIPSAREARRQERRRRAASARRAGRRQAMQHQLVPRHRAGLRRLDPAGAAVGRLSERKGRLTPEALSLVSQFGSSIKFSASSEANFRNQSDTSNSMNLVFL